MPYDDAHYSILTSEDFRTKRYSIIGCDVIVSLTSFPARLKQPELLELCLNSLVSQNTKYKYNIVLTLFKNDIQYVSKRTLDFCYSHGIEILPCNEDLKGHKKYFYVMQKYPGIPIIVVDDDLIFYDNLVESLMDSYMGNRNVIWTGWCQNMSLTPEGKFIYSEYALGSNSSDEKPSFRYKFGSGSGTLIPPQLIDDFQYVFNLVRQGDNIFHDELVLKKLSLDRGIKVGLCLNKKYRCASDKWFTPTQFIEDEISTLVECRGNLHSINLTKITDNGVQKWRGLTTEMRLIGNYTIQDDFCSIG